MVGTGLVLSSCGGNRSQPEQAAREDTIIFQTWKQTMMAKQLGEMGDKFEDIEHEQFGEDG